jgi:hypothetical protein
MLGEEISEVEVEGMINDAYEISAPGHSGQQLPSSDFFSKKSQESSNDNRGSQALQLGRKRHKRALSNPCPPNTKSQLTGFPRLSQS